MPPQTKCVTTPYNFVPLNRDVLKAEKICPDLSALPLQDEPQKVRSGRGALCGEIPFEVVVPNGVPILIGGKQTQGSSREFMTAPDESGSEKPTIPGSSLRGMIRNVMEIASFGRMALVDDQRVGVRDLDASSKVDYRDRLLTKVHAGWLCLQAGVYRVKPCKFARISHQDLDEFEITNNFRNYVDRWYEVDGDLARANSCDHFSFPKYDMAGEAFDLANAAGVYALFESRICDRAVDTNPFMTTLLVGDANEPKGKFERASYTDVDFPRAKPKKKKGTIVLTGLPSEAKRWEFFFYDTADTVKKIQAKTWRKFIAVNEELEKPNDTWKWRKSQLSAGESVPVFYLTENGKPDGAITDIGLAMMFKLGADNSVHDLIRNTDEARLDPHIIDLPTRIFGRAPDPKAGIDGFRTRVSFGWAQLQTDYDTCTHETSSLSKPKVSYTPAYIRQRDFGDDNGNLARGTTHLPRRADGGKWKLTAQYRSYMGWWLNGEVQKEEIRGWKRYPVRKKPLEELRPVVNDGTKSTLKPILAKNDEPLKFSGVIRYHNLHPVELGALVWALTWGGNSKLHHALGTGKKFGWGRCRIELQSDNDLQKAQDCFVNAMEGVLEGWCDTPQMKALLAMADPCVGERNEALLEEMKLSVTPRRNDFVDAKKSGEVLPEYCGGEFGRNNDPRRAKTEQNAEAPPPVVATSPDETTAPEQAVAVTPEPLQNDLPSHIRVGASVWVKDYLRGFGGPEEEVVATITEIDDNFVHTVYPLNGGERKRKFPHGTEMRPVDGPS